MHKLRSILLALLLSLAPAGSFAQQGSTPHDRLPAELSPPDVFVETWQGGAKAAISLTFDDATLDHWEVGMPMWEEYGYRVTLGIITSTFEDNPLRYRQLQMAFDAGHELANHTTTHPDLTEAGDWELRQELRLCKEMLTTKVRGLDQVHTVIYPYEQFDERVMGELADQGYLFARSGAQGVTDVCQLNDAYQPQFLGLYSWANQAELPMWMWNSTVDWALEHGGWLIEQCHGIGTLGQKGVGWSPRPESDFRQHYDHMRSYGELLWVAPMADVGRYIMERNAAKLSVLESTPTRIELQLSSELDPEIFDVPLTISLTPPPGWSEFRVHRGGVELPSILRSQLRFDAVPGSEPIFVERVR